MVSVRPAAVVLVTGLLLAGCAGTPAADDRPVTATATTEAAPATPTAGEWSEFVEMSTDIPPVAIDGWTTRDPIVAWAEQYCEREALSPCTGIAGRAVDICIERWDCHPALLVPFDEGTAAFLSGGIFPQPQVIAVWRAESDPELAQYGGARALLQAYLLTVGVCPAVDGSTPRGARCPRG